MNRNSLTIIAGKNGQLVYNPYSQSINDFALLLPAEHNITSISRDDVEYVGDIWTVPCDPLESADSAAVAYTCACEYMNAEWLYPDDILSVGDYLTRIQHVLDGV